MAGEVHTVRIPIDRCRLRSVRTIPLEPYNSGLMANSFNSTVFCCCCCCYHQIPINATLQLEVIGLAIIHSLGKFVTARALENMTLDIARDAAENETKYTARYETLSAE